MSLALEELRLFLERLPLAKDAPVVLRYSRYPSNREILHGEIGFVALTGEKIVAKLGVQQDGTLLVRRRRGEWQRASSTVKLVNWVVI